MQNKVNIALKVLYDIVVGAKELYMMVVYIIVGLVIFLNADVHLALIQNLYVAHKLVYYILIYFPCLFPQVQKVLVVAIPQILHFLTVSKQFPYRRETLQFVLIDVDLFEVGEIELRFSSRGKSVVIEIQMLKAREEEEIEFVNIVV